MTSFLTERLCTIKFNEKHHPMFQIFTSLLMVFERLLFQKEKHQYSILTHICGI